MEDFVTFELAKKLKEKGFPQKTAGRYNMIDCFYHEDGKLFFNGGACDVNEAYTAPTISQVLKWLREEKNVSFSIFLHCSLKWVQDIHVFGEGLFMDYTPYLEVIDVANDTFYILYDSYEEAAIAGIEYILDNVI